MKNQKLRLKTETEKIHEKKKLKSLGPFLRGEVHKIGRREKLAEKVGRREKLAEKVGRKEKLAEKVGRKEKLAEKVGRREIYPPVPPPFSSTYILTEN